ncbi:MAG TPA: bifunctional demethylmenaquinone methyltransferase/2-methoxy-6-polyprenyl-1,4-benzoquinol methylase, partial [Candidatus Latescibacteria bacterium]|nr:bifunctional demethylmenaquinone methyltransferase/2-methoxy-6-polyprenyl-1,4-benzoquinol methylase [Candidatus Latescibacterota bacterium]
MFDGIAGTYDLLNHVLSVGTDIIWRRRTITGLNIQPGCLLLDLATGTGDLAFEALTRHPETRIVGADLSVPMMSIGRKKDARGHGSVRFVCGDAEYLPFNNRTFDAISIGFGVRNFSRLTVGLNEMWRVLRPGGKVAILEFSKPKAILMRTLYLFYFKNVLPVIG